MGKKYLCDKEKEEEEKTKNINIGHTICFIQ
jgi:hypothetical protein